MWQVFSLVRQPHTPIVTAKKFAGVVCPLPHPRDVAKLSIITRFSTGTEDNKHEKTPSCL